MTQARTLCVAALAVSLLHGLIPTPLFGMVVAWSPLWWPFVFAPTQSLLIYATALLISFATLLVGGLPAALYERVTRQPETSSVSAAIWLAGTVAITMLGLASRG